VQQNATQPNTWDQLSQSTVVINPNLIIAHWVNKQHTPLQRYKQLYKNDFEEVKHVI